jgi:hypothetical protein
MASITVPTAVSRMMGVVSLAESPNLSAVTTPKLVIYSPNEQIVSVGATETRLAKIGAARKQVIP